MTVGFVTAPPAALQGFGAEIKMLRCMLSRSLVAGAPRRMVLTSNCPAPSSVGTSSVSSPTQSQSMFSRSFFVGSAFGRTRALQVNVASALEAARTPRDRSTFSTRAEAETVEFDTVRASHILVETEQEVEELLSRVEKGENFAELAQASSKCPSGRTGGDLGWFKKGMMVPEFEQVSFEVGNLGRTLKVQTQFGWHLVNVTGQRSGPKALSVQDFAKIYTERPDEVQLIDVREASELAISSLPGFIHMPLSDAKTWAPELEAGKRLDKDKETIVMCHKGMRSAQMCAFLDQIGFTSVRNLTGGIGAYADQVDPAVPTY